MTIDLRGWEGMERPLGTNEGKETRERAEMAYDPGSWGVPGRVRVMFLEDPSHCSEGRQLEGTKPGQEEQEGGCFWDPGEM